MSQEGQNSFVSAEEEDEGPESREAREESKGGSSDLEEESKNSDHSTRP